jgi:hypothetical protein
MSSFHLCTPRMTKQVAIFPKVLIQDSGIQVGPGPIWNVRTIAVAFCGAVVHNELR